MAGGALPLPNGYTPKCGDWYTMSKKGLTSSLGTGQEMGWYEMYTVKPRAVNLDRLVQQLTQHGYTFVMKLDYGETQGRRLKNKLEECSIYLSGRWRTTRSTSSCA